MAGAKWILKCIDTTYLLKFKLMPQNLLVLILQQDNDPEHTAKAKNEFFEAKKNVDSWVAKSITRSEPN